MIFSTDLCPLCNSKLEMLVKQEVTQTIMFVYFCNNKKICRDLANSKNIFDNHYKCYNRNNEQQYAIMITDDYIIKHYKEYNETGVYLNNKNSCMKFIFDCPLLDIDYSQPHVINNKLKLLSILS